MALDDRIRASDADRDRVTARLRDHFAEGRLTREELDDRVSAALGARTLGDLRGILVDLPEPAPAGLAGVGPSQARFAPRASRAPMAYRRRGPRILPLLAIVVLLSVLVPHAGWVLFGFAQVLLVVWLVAAIGALFAVARFRHRARRHWQGEHWQGEHWHHHRYLRQGPWQQGPWQQGYFRS